MPQSADPRQDAIRPDGRRLRTEESRRRVIAALLDCVRDGDFDPSADTVAHRAGVGLRTVFRLFKDKEGLFQQMSQAVMAGLADVAGTPLRGETWRQRLDDLMLRRFAIYDDVMAYRRAALVHAHASKVVQANNAVLATTLRQLVVGVLPPAICDDGPALDALDMTLHIDTWIHLRTDQGLDPDHAAAAVRRIVSALTAGVG
jgi:AcrR family transcriptional regulator